MFIPSGGILIAVCSHPEPSTSTRVLLVLLACAFFAEHAPDVCLSQCPSSMSVSVVPLELSFCVFHPFRDGTLAVPISSSPSELVTLGGPTAKA